MPDVVFYDEKKDWLYFVEAVTSVGPMDPKRIVELADLNKNVKVIIPERRSRQSGEVRATSPA
jgi:accessory colonization factor AcfC